jgi:UPF0042 nucleotide-binding protein
MGRSEQLRIVLYSFGFKYGTPVDVNLVWDVRFLPNPYWVEGLRPKTGKVKEVADYVLQSDEGTSFFLHLSRCCNFLLNRTASPARTQFESLLAAREEGTVLLRLPRKSPLFC